jgi:adsorption protein B
MALEGLDIAATCLAYPVGGAISLNQLDDLFVDLRYLVGGLWRRSRRVVTVEALRNVEQKRIAILLPAWKEAEVISQMLEHNLGAIDYDSDRYEFFCGTYRNDPETQACVDRVARRDRRVHKVVVPNDGPTSKADCLNWVYQGILLEERRRGVRFDVLLMHDAEDLVHPLSLRLYSLLIPRYEFVQTPVFSLELGVGQLVAGTYIDEFAEHHLKDMQVRQAIGGLVPSAGVGSAFDRSAFEEIAASHGQQPFHPTSLTEDYEIGVKFRLAGKRVCFACHVVEHEGIATRGLLRKREERVVREEYVATREYFPAGFQASVRQRSRWILGIALQTWEQIGWRGTLPVLYCLWRDRKGVWNSLLVALAYALFAYVLGRSALGAVQGVPWSPSRVAAPGSLLAWILAFNMAALAWRTAVKAHFVGRLYGPVQALLVPPRLVLANVIGILATGRALRTYLRHRITGEPLRWLKTAHTFPSAEVLRARRLRLGELLVDRRDVDGRDVAVALALQRRLDLPLGEILTASGMASARRVVSGLAEQLDLPVGHPDPAEVPVELLASLPETEAEEMDVLPVSRPGAETVRVAVARPLSPEDRARLEGRLGSSVEPVLCQQRAVTRGRSVAYRRLPDLSPPRPRLGERLVAHGLLDRTALPELLEEHLETGEMLGEMLVRKGLIDVRGLAWALWFDGGFRQLDPDEGDPAAVERLGYGHCAIYSLVPLRRTASDRRRVVASVYPVHPLERLALAERLDEPVETVLAPSMDVRTALAKARRDGPRGPRLGLDELELAALARLGLRRPVDLASLAWREGASPLEHLGRRGLVPARVEAQARAEVLGLPIVPAGEGTVGGGLLPPRLETRHAIEVRSAEPGALTLATPRPSPALAQEVAELLPGWRIAWQVVTPGPDPVEARDASATRD